jgi:hypothetical protein
MKKMNVADAGLNSLSVVGLCHSVKVHNLRDLGVPALQVMVCGLHGCNIDEWEGKAGPEEVGFEKRHLCHFGLEDWVKCQLADGKVVAMNGLLSASST